MRVFALALTLYMASCAFFRCFVFFMLLLSVTFRSILLKWTNRYSICDIFTFLITLRSQNIFTLCFIAFVLAGVEGRPLFYRCREANLPAWLLRFSNVALFSLSLHFPFVLCCFVCRFLRYVRVYFSFILSLHPQIMIWLLFAFESRVFLFTTCCRLFQLFRLPHQQKCFLLSSAAAAAATSTTITFHRRRFTLV